MTDERLTFTVYGDGSASGQVAKRKNPVPAVRTTQRKKWGDPQFKRYLAYKDHVVATLHAEVENGALRLQQIHESLKTKRVQYILDARISFVGKGHADSDNVVKALLDSLFPARDGGPGDNLVQGRISAVADCQPEGWVRIVIHGPYPRDTWVNPINEA